MNNKVVVIVGGYGVVGAELARMLRRHYPGLKLVLIGRRQLEAKKLASELGNAEGMAASLEDVSYALLSDLSADLVVAAVSDPQRTLLRAALRAQVAYLDFAIAGQPIIDAMNLSLQSGGKTPVALISNWMAGVPAILAKEMVQTFDEVTNVELDILYYSDDRGGPDTAGAVSEFAKPFLAMRDGSWTRVLPMREPKTVEFLSGKRRTTTATNMPDLQSIAYASNAKNVFVRLGMENETEARLMAFMVRSGVWALLPESVKRSIMYNPGEGASHEIIVSITGTKKAVPREESVKLLDPAGQVHLTALGVTHTVDELLGLSSGVANKVRGPVFPEVIGNPSGLRELLKKEGVEVSG